MCQQDADQPSQLDSQGFSLQGPRRRHSLPSASLPSTQPRGIFLTLEGAVVFGISNLWSTLLPSLHSSLSISSFETWQRCPISQETFPFRDRSALVQRPFKGCSLNLHPELRCVTLCRHRGPALWAPASQGHRRATSPARAAPGPSRLPRNQQVSIPAFGWPLPPHFQRHHVFLIHWGPLGIRGLHNPGPVLSGQLLRLACPSGKGHTGILRGREETSE